MLLIAVLLAICAYGSAKFPTRTPEQEDSALLLSALFTAGAFFAIMAVAAK